MLLIASYKYNQKMLCLNIILYPALKARSVILLIIIFSSQSLLLCLQKLKFKLDQILYNFRGQEKSIIINLK